MGVAALKEGHGQRGRMRQHMEGGPPLRPDEDLYATDLTRAPSFRLSLLPQLVTRH